MSHAITIRPATDGDRAELTRLASLDEAEMPRGEVLLGIVDGEVQAAVPVEGGSPVADPFRYTQDLVGLLRMRATQAA